MPGASFQLAALRARERLLVIHQLLFIFLSAGSAFAAANWTVPYVDLRNYNVPSVTATAYDAATRKFYLGMLAHDLQALAVYDIDTTNGIVTGSPRRYPVQSEALMSNNWVAVNCILIDKRHQKLFLGLGHAFLVYPKCLVMYALDANGEPSGQPQAYSNGNPHYVCNALFLHPTFDRLYAVGWGSPAVHMLSLNASGVPNGALTNFGVGSYGKYSLALRNPASRMYLGTYPATLEVCDVSTTSGRITGGPRSYSATNAPQNEYLRMCANNRGIYYRSVDGYLAYFALNSSGEPTGIVRRLTNIAAQACGMEATNWLVAAVPATFKDAVTGATCTNGVALRQFTNGTTAIPNLVMRETPVFERVKVAQMGTAPNTGFAASYLSGFLGNRLNGLCVRFQVADLTPISILSPHVHSTVFSPHPQYLKFAYATNFNRVYATDSNTIYAYSLACTGSLYAVAAISNSAATAVDESLSVLYVAQADGSVEARELDASGRPAATGEVVATGLKPITVLRVNPLTHHLYVCGQGTAVGPLTNPATPFAQRLIRIPAGAYSSDAAVDPAQGRFYVCTSYGGANGHTNLLIWSLAVDGTLQSTIPRSYRDGIPEGTNHYRGLVSALKVDPARQRLYLGGYAEDYYLNAGRGFIILYSLDGQGEPTGEPRLYPSANVHSCINALELSPDRQWIYDAGWGDARFFMRRLDEAGEPTTNAPIAWPCGSYGKYQLTITADRSNLLMGTWSSALEIAALYTNGWPREGLNAAFQIGSQSTNFGFLEEGDATAWLNLDPTLTGTYGLTKGTLTFSGGTASNVSLIVEMARWDGTNYIIVTNFTATTLGNTVAILFPGYGLESSQTGTWATLAESDTEAFQRYATWAQTNALKLEERPRQFVVANGLIGMGSPYESLTNGLQALSTLGHNTAQIWNFSPQIPASRIHDAAVSNGIRRFRFAIYNPPSYFDYNTDMVSVAYLDNWAAGFRANLAGMGAASNELALFHMADEPGWYYPSQYTAVTSHPERLAVFREYLQGKGFAPALFGYTNWSQIFPLGLSGATNLPSKRLLFWTARFYAESLSKAFAAATAALQRQLNPRLLVGSNLNNWPGRFFIPSPNAPIANNPDIDPDSAMGMPDWFDLGRKQAVSCMWTEDWFGDTSAQYWSLYADLMRCAAREGGLEFGGYTVGQSMGSMWPEGGKYKIMALVGHGAKAIDPYVFGSWFAFGDCWSEKLITYPSVSAGFRLMGKGESLLYPGRPRNGTVAILLPQASQVWDTNSLTRLYLHELYGLHMGLTHLQYPVDFIDDFGVETGALQRLNYSALYVTAPNLSTNAQHRILSWVNSGGTLALLPGACMSDEYNEPVNVMSQAMGAAWGAAPRGLPTTLSDTQVVITVTDARLGTTSDVTRLQIAGLTTNGGSALARFANVKAALVEKSYGAGRILSYGYWPGSTYLQTPDTFEKTKLPLRWNTNTLAMLTAPARLGNARKHVSASVNGVETALLESDQGLAITLLNWTGQPLSQVTISVPLSGPLLHAARLTASSVERGSLSFAVTHAALAVSLPLGTVDVLLIRTGAPTGQVLMLR